MSRNTIEVEFADGQYVFALPLPRLDELQLKTKIGIGGLYGRLTKGCLVIGGKLHVNPHETEFFAVDIIETIRQGLIGGGRGTVNGTEVKVTPPLAERLIQNYVMTQPLIDHLSVAGAIVGACVVGYDPPKKDEPAAARATKKRKKAASTTP